MFTEHFWDAENGGFYFSAEDSEKLLVRTKEFYDGAMPSGNSIAMMNLLRLGRITGDSKMEERAYEIARSASQSVNKVPRAFTALLSSVDFGVGPTMEVVITGNEGEADTEKMVRALWGKYLPHKVLLFRDPGWNSSIVDEIAPWTKEMKAVDDRATAYICVEHSCLLPTTDAKRLVESLDGGNRK